MQINRRKFIKTSSLSFVSFWACLSDNSHKQSFLYPIHLHSDHHVGHLVFQDLNFATNSPIKKDILVVGGGIAGMSAAYQLRAQSMALCELAPSLGGSAGNNQYQGLQFSQGAHYDLSYPSYFGKETLQFLESLDIIYYDPQKMYWDFTDKKYLISEEREGRSYRNQKYYEDVFLDNFESRDFIKHTEQYIGSLPLPTRLIDSEYHYLNKRTFYQYLEDYGLTNPQLIQSIDYQMYDDYGGSSREVSALAGLFYYAGRPYLDKYAQEFSPPQGNYYFIEKMAEHIPPESILLSHLVRRIQKNKGGFEVEVVDIVAKAIKIFQVKKIIYAGQKHALKYIYPADYPLFEKNKYSPWLVINFVLKNELPSKGFWQNEFIPIEDYFLGFVDSQAQQSKSDKYRVLTAYYCFPMDAREHLSEIADWSQSLVENTVQAICPYLKVSKAVFDEAIEQVFIKVMGHAMPLPEVNYLFSNPNSKRSEPNLVYAGVDTGRLPLFLDAVDSGLQAVKELNLS